MGSTPFQIVGFVAFVLGGFIALGAYMNALSGNAGFQTVSNEISAETGAALFHGKGRCATCHSIGTEGSTVRGPNLGVKPGQFEQPVAVRAAGLKKGLTAIEYLVESVYEPGAFSVPGFPPNLMSPSDQPPIALTDEELRSVLLFLLLKSGLDPDALAPEVERAQRRFAGRSKVAAAAKSPQAVKLLQGDAAKGKAAFVELQCVLCHRVQGVTLGGGAPSTAGLGPDLAGVGGVHDEPYLFESILNPSAVILADPSPSQRYSEGGKSKMPDLSEAMTLKQAVDLVAFLKSLQEVPASP